MRNVLEHGLSSADAVKAYHADLAAHGIRPHRDLHDDLALSDPLLQQHAG
jgi:hypothetical protein